MARLEKIINGLVYIWLFLLPWQTVYIWHEAFLNNTKWQYGTIVTYATEILLLVIVILSVIAKQSHLKLMRSPRSMRSLAMALLIWSVFSVFWSLDRSLALYQCLHLFEAILLIWLFLNLKLGSKKIAWSLALSGAVQAFWSIWQFAAQEIVANKWLGVAAHSVKIPGTIVVVADGHNWLRVYGGLPHPNVLGGFLAVALLLAVWLYLNYSPGWRKLTALFFSVAIVVGVFLSFSRSAWLGLVVAYGLWLIVGLWRRSQSASIIKIELIKITVYLIAVVVALVIFFWPLVQTRLTQSDSLEIRSTQERLTSYRDAAGLLKNNWLLGTGAGNYTLALYQKDSTLPGYAYQPAHNIYLLVFSELGIVGLIIFLLLCWGLLTRGIKGALSLVFFPPLIVVVLIVGLFDHYLWSSYFGLLLFFLAAFLLRPPDNPETT